MDTLDSLCIHWTDILLSEKSQRDVGTVAVYILKDSGYVFLLFSHVLNITKRLVAQ